MQKYTAIIGLIIVFLLGGVGTSGSSVENDHAVATAGAKVFA